MGDRILNHIQGGIGLCFRNNTDQITNSLFIVPSVLTFFHRFLGIDHHFLGGRGSITKKNSFQIDTAEKNGVTRREDKEKSLKKI